jgi:hypothetical protein
VVPTRVAWGGAWRGEPQVDNSREPALSPTQTNKCSRPKSGFSRLIRRIKSRTSLGTAGRPALPRRIFQVQKSRKPLRCQAMTVAGCTMARADCHSFQTRARTTHNQRSAGRNRGRLTERFRMFTWWRKQGSPVPMRRGSGEGIEKRQTRSTERTSKASSEAANFHHLKLWVSKTRNSVPWAGRGGYCRRKRALENSANRLWRS